MYLYTKVSVTLLQISKEWQIVIITLLLYDVALQ